MRLFVFQTKKLFKKNFICKILKYYSKFYEKSITESRLQLFVIEKKVISKTK